MKKFPIIESIVFAIVLLLDQLSKIIVALTLQPGQSAVVVSKWIYITHTHNSGTIWGIAQGSNYIFAIIAVAVICLVLFMSPKITNSLFSKICLGAILGGAIGNLVDRIFRGFVIDFIEFRIINFPVFNVADIGIVCGAILLAISMLFAPKEQN